MGAGSPSFDFSFNLFQPLNIKIENIKLESYSPIMLNTISSLIWKVWLMKIQVIEKGEI